MKGVIILLVTILYYAACSIVVPVTDSNWFFTKQNWYKDPSGKYAQTANPGAYFKVSFTGSFSASLWINQTLSPKTPFQNLRFSVDNKPWIDVLLPDNKSDYIQLATGLSATESHYILLFLKNSLQSVDRWISGPPDRLCVNGLVLEDNGKTVPTPIFPKSMMVFWDSIGEGVRILGATNGGDLTDNDGTQTWGIAMAAGLGAEVSMVAFGAQGLTVGGNGNTPPLFIPGNDAGSAWNKFDLQHSRLDANGLLIGQPDYIVCGHGTNDGLRGANPEDVTEAALGWLAAQRKAAPKASIFLVVPFGAFMEDALTTAFQQYKSKTQDNNVFLIDMPDARPGLQQWGATIYSDDGIHPLAFRDGQLGSMLAVNIVQALQQK